LKSPAYLEARNQQYNLGLVPPREGQTVRLWEPTPAWDAQFLARRTAGGTKNVVAQR